MKPGRRVRIVVGPDSGLVGVVLTVTADGVAVRLDARAGWPFPSSDVRVVSRRHLVALPRVRSVLSGDPALI